MPIEKEELDILLSSQLAPIIVDLPKIVEGLNKLKELILDLKASIEKIKIDEVTIKPEKQELTILESLEIRDTVWHRSEIAETTKFDVNTVWIRNDLNQSVEVQIMGNFTATHLNAAVIKDGLVIAPNETLARNINIYTSDWLPFIFIQVKASATPTTGAISAKLIQRKW